MARGSDSRLDDPAADCNKLPCRALPPRCVVTGPHCWALQPRPRRTRQLAVVSFDNSRADEFALFCLVAKNNY